MRDRRGVAVAVLAALLAPLAAPASGAPACVRCVTAGAAAVELRVPEGAPLAGYGSMARRLVLPDVLGRHPHAFWFRPHEGMLDPLRVRALVVEGGGQRLVWVAVDLIAVARDFTERLADRLRQAGLRPATLVVSASHTHSGPGAFLDSAVMGFIAADREDAAVRDAVVERVIEAVRAAEARRAPARIGAAAAQAPALTKGRLGHPVDQEVVVVKVVADGGAPVAVLWNFAIHGTMLGPGNLRLSADVMGAAAAAVERDLGVPALFVNGAVGDVSPRRHGAGEMGDVGQALARAVRAAWERARPSAEVPLDARQARVALPAPRLSLRNCVARWLPAGLTLALDSVFPGDASLLAGRLGDVLWVTIPGELQSRLGEEVKRAAGGARAVVAGLSNDYLGYFLTSEEYDRPSYVSCASLYGPSAGERLARAAADLVRSLVGAGR